MAGVTRSTGEENMAERDGATLMVRSLQRQGVDVLFRGVGFRGGPIAAAARKAGITCGGASAPDYSMSRWRRRSRSMATLAPAAWTCRRRDAA
jgi:hypothetical protein